MLFQPANTSPPLRRLLRGDPKGGTSLQNPEISQVIERRNDVAVAIPYGSQRSRGLGSNIRGERAHPRAVRDPGEAAREQAGHRSGGVAPQVNGKVVPTKAAGGGQAVTAAPLPKAVHQRGSVRLARR